jgi:hypothetical protein
VTMGWGGDSVQAKVGTFILSRARRYRLTLLTHRIMRALQASS